MLRFPKNFDKSKIPTDALIRYASWISKSSPKTREEAIQILINNLCWQQ